MKNLLRRIAVGGLVLIAVLTVALVIAGDTNNLLTPVHLLLFVIALAIYLLPTALAFCRSCKSALWIAVLNDFLGWTLLAGLWRLDGQQVAKPRRYPQFQVCRTRHRKGIHGLHGHHGIDTLIPSWAQTHSEQVEAV